jgi:transcription elongation factor Elf1
MEVETFSGVYPGQDPEILSNEAIIRKRNEVILDKDSDDPLPYCYCPMCGKQNFSRHSIQRPDATVYYISCLSCGWGERSEM